MLFLKIEMENHFYNLFISSYYNSYFLKFLNENELDIHQYLLCPTWNKANNKEYTVFCIALNYIIFMMAIKNFKY